MIEFEPLYPPQEFILEDSLRREAERVAHQEAAMDRVVYDCQDASPYNQGIEPPEGEFLPFYTPTSSNDYTLIFESRFESGNLRRAIQVYEFEYDLILKPDYNTRGYTQWYYFRIGNTRAGKTYRFNIINMMKPDSLYNHGMRPVVYSEMEAKRSGKGWFRGGSDICYYQNSMKRKNAGYYYTLTFSMQFDHDGDTVYLAHCYPYTYTDLMRYLNHIELDPKRKNRLRRRTLTPTIAGNNCEMVIITTFQSDPDAIKNRKGVVITSRVHPGESGSSWIMKGVLDYLTGPSLNAKILRDNFVFKIVPMLNPDGVINGSTRCNLAGVDLNRIWNDPQRKIHPTIYHTKMMIKKLQEDRDIFLFCDIHGHSRKKNVFMYGNSGKVNDRLKEKIFPCLLDKNSDIFNFSDCNFAVQKAKESTARVVIWKEQGITNSFTLEASFCGADQGKFADYHFNTDMLQEIGHRFCDTILDFCDPDQVKVKAVLEELEIMLPKASESGSDEESDGESDYSGEEGGDKKKKGNKGGASNNANPGNSGGNTAGAGGVSGAGAGGPGASGTLAAQA